MEFTNAMSAVARHRVAIGRRGSTQGFYLVGALASFGIAGCVRFRPQPIDPPAALTALESRTLTDSSLARLVRANQAVTTWPPAAWDLPSLTLAAFYFNPELDIARSQWAATRAARVTAGEHPNPNVSLAPGYNSSTAASDITPWILTLDLDLTLTTAGKRGHRIAQAQRLSEAARLAVATSAWQVRSRVRASLLDLYAASGAVALLQRQQAIHESNVALMQRQLAAGAISAFELSQARLLLDANRLALHDAERDLARARVTLAAAIGVTAPALEGVMFEFAAFERAPAELAPAAMRRRALLNRPDILGALFRYEASQSDLQLEIARQYPDIHLGPGYQMDQNANKWTLGLAGLLPVLNRNRGPIAEAEARRAEAAANFTAVQSRAIEQIDGAIAAYRAALAKLATTDTLVADRQRLQTSADAQFAAGNISRLELGTIQLELTRAEAARFDALVNAQRAVGQLEDAMQSPALLSDWLIFSGRPTPTLNQ